MSIDLSSTSVDEVNLPVDNERPIFGFSDFYIWHVVGGGSALIALAFDIIGSRF